MVDGPQDPLVVSALVHELGNGFPIGEAIWSATFAATSYAPCPESDEGMMPNMVVAIKNMTGFSWSELWYVADRETALTNNDGTINGGLAFKIDNGPDQLN